MTQYLREKVRFYKLPLTACVLFKYLIPFNPFLLTINCATNRAMIAALRVQLVAVCTTNPTSIPPDKNLEQWREGGTSARLMLCRGNGGQIARLCGLHNYNPFLSRAFPTEHAVYQLARQERSRIEHNQASFEQPCVM